VVLNVKFHLFRELTNQYTVVIVSDKTNHKIQEVIDIPEMIEVHETIEVQDIPEMIEVHVQGEMILDLEDQVMINF